MSAAVAQRRDLLSRTVDEVALFLVTSADEWDEYHLHADGRRLSPMRFDGALPIYAPDLIRRESDTAEVFFRDVVPGDLSDPLNLALIGSIIDDDGRERVPGLHLDRFQQVSLAEVRGKVRHVSRWMVAWDMAMIPEVGTAEAIRCYCGSLGPNERMGLSLKAGTWGVAGTNHVWLPGYSDGTMPSKETISLATTMINGALSIAFSSRYNWHVRIGYAGMPSLRVPVDELGVRTLFSNRDLAEGQDRRTALKHWVSSHWRRTALDDGELESLVRRYLRGEVSFTWSGLVCTLEPSAFDIDKNEELRRARAAMRKADTRRPARKGGAR